MTSRQPGIDPPIGELLQKVRASGRAAYWEGTPQSARARPTLVQLMFGPAPEVERIESLAFTSADGSTIPARLYLPKQAAALIVYFHGGGWVVGSVEGYHAFNADLSLQTGCAVLAVDYRLAPEHPFPAAVEDSVAALAFAAENRARWLGREGCPLLVVGDSAGAALATVAARRHNRAHPQDPSDLQVLVYPICDARFDTASYAAFAEDHLLTLRDMQWFWDQYCPDPALREDGDCAPLRQQDLSASPPALVVTAALDPLRDEGERYAARLQEQGVRTESIRAEGVVHGFLSMVNFSPAARQAYARVVERIRAVAAG